MAALRITDGYFDSDNLSADSEADDSMDNTPLLGRAPRLAADSTELAASFSKLRLPPWRLLVTGLMYSLLAGFPIGYHAGVLNEPEDMLTQFVNHSWHVHYGIYLSEYNLSVLWSFILSVYLIGALLGALSVNAVAGAFGRRNPLFIYNNILHVVGSVLLFSAYFANSFELLICGRLLVGFGVGMGSGLLALYLTECSPDAFRGFVANFENFAVTVATFVSTLVSLPLALGTPTHWPYLLGLGVLPAVLQIFLSPLAPETPKFLYIQRRNSQAAKRSLLFYYGLHADVQEALAEFERESVLEEGQIGINAAFQHRHYRIPILLGCLTSGAAMTSGILAIFSYSSDMFEHAGVSRTVSLYATPIMSAFNLLGSILALPLLDRVGRRPLLLGGLTVNIACCILYIISAEIAKKVSRVAWLSVAVIMVHVCAYNMGPGAISWFLGAEMTPQRVRSVAVSLSTAANACASLIVVQLYLILEKVAGPFAYLLFIIPTVFAVIILFCWLPETKNRTIDDIVIEWEFRTSEADIVTAIANDDTRNDMT